MIPVGCTLVTVMCCRGCDMEPNKNLSKANVNPSEHSPNQIIQSCCSTEQTTIQKDIGIVRSFW